METFKIKLLEYDFRPDDTFFGKILFTRKHRKHTYIRTCIQVHAHAGKDNNRGGETNYAQMVRPYISIKYVGFKFGKNTFYVYKN